MTNDEVVEHLRQMPARAQAQLEAFAASHQAVMNAAEKVFSTPSPDLLDLLEPLSDECVSRVSGRLHQWACNSMDGVMQKVATASELQCWN